MFLENVENKFTVGGFREGRSGYSKHNFFFALLNKYALIWSIFVISINGSYILQTPNAAECFFCRSSQPKLVSSRLLCLNAFHVVTLPCPANWLTVLRHGMQVMSNRVVG